MSVGEHKKSTGLLVYEAESSNKANSSYTIVKQSTRHIILNMVFHCAIIYGGTSRDHVVTYRDYGVQVCGALKLLMGL